jgi:hypothetical protein
MRDSPRTETTINILGKRILLLLSDLGWDGGTFKHPICYAVEDLFVTVKCHTFSRLSVEVTDVYVVVEYIGYSGVSR